MSQDEMSPCLGAPLAAGEWAGWSKWTGDEPFEDHVGPFYGRRDDDSRMICGCVVEAKNMNGGGSVHGGALMTFADYSLFILAYDELRGLSAVTVSLTAEFLAGAPLGARLIARGEVLKSGRSLLFVRGLIEAGGAPVLNFSGVVKIIRAPT